MSGQNKKIQQNQLSCTSGSRGLTNIQLQYQLCASTGILSLLRKANHANYSWSCLETKLQRGFNFSVFFSFLFMAPEVVTHKFMDTI